MSRPLTKYILLWRLPASLPEDELLNTARSTITPTLQTLQPAGLKFSLSTGRPRWSYLPLQRQSLLMISLWLDGEGQESTIRACLPDRPGPAMIHAVQESVPVAYTRTWPDGEASPGITLLTIMRRNPSLNPAQFLEEWHGHHTPMAMAIHPLWNYIRNVPDGTGGDGPDGIVEEHFRQRADPLNPARMFGGLLAMLPNMLRVGRHVSHFLDLRRCENYLLREYWIQSPIT